MRELENVIERAAYLARGQTLLLEHLPEELRTYQNSLVNIPERPSLSENGQSIDIPLGTPLEVVREMFVRQTLARLDGDRTEAVSVLGVSLRTLQRMLKKYDI